MVGGRTISSDNFADAAPDTTGTQQGGSVLRGCNSPVLVEGNRGGSPVDQWNRNACLDMARVFPPPRQLPRVFEHWAKDSNTWTPRITKPEFHITDAATNGKIHGERRTRKGTSSKTGSQMMQQSSLSPEQTR